MAGFGRPCLLCFTGLRPDRGPSAIDDVDLRGAGLHPVDERLQLHPVSLSGHIFELRLPLIESRFKVFRSCANTSTSSPPDVALPTMEQNILGARYVLPYSRPGYGCSDSRFQIWPRCA